MDEIDAVVEVIEDESTNIWNSTNGSSDGKGKIGQLFCRRAIKQWFFYRGYKLRKKGNETFTVNKEDTTYGGPDFIVKFTDSNCKNFQLLLEMKNFKYYKNGISPSNYKTWILDKYPIVDNPNNRRCYWAVAINKRNIQFIWKNCGMDKIHIIPIEEHLTNRFINKHKLKPIFLKFMKNLNDLIDNIMLGWIKV